MSRARDLADSADKDISGTLNLDGLDVAGNITVTGTVDGRDVATDGTKLDGVEAGADVTDVTNVTAAGALMDSEVTNLAQVKAFSSSDYATAAQGTTADAALPKAGGTMTGAITFAAGQTFDGRDVSADGSKLDGIESGATADQTASEILTAIKTVDGSGSGLDADTLDGQQGSYYYAASNPSGYTTFTANQSLNTTSSPTFASPNLTSALSMGGTQVLSSSRALTNIASVDAATVAALTAAGVGGGAVAYQSTAPSNPSNGDLWVNTNVNDGYFKIYTFGSWKDIEWVGQGNTYSGGHLYTQASTGSTSTYTFTVPSGVKLISAVCIGQGGSGVNWETVGGNGGGALAYKNNISVSAGDTFTITLSSTGSTFYKAGVVNLVAGAASGRSGGTYSGADGGGNGGDGGINNYSQGPYYAGTGSGGAGGYSGAGGSGGTLNSLTGVNGNAGSGGGAGAGGGAYDNGYNSGYGGGAAGGGTCPYGEGTSGAAGTGDTIANSGNNVTAGGHGSIDVTVPNSTSINTIAFGAGAGGGYASAAIPSRGTQRGCCRIVWGLGNNQSFPTTNVGYRDGNAGGTQIEGYN